MRNHASNDTNSRPGLPDSLKRKQRIKVLSRVLPCLVLLIIDLILIKYLGSVLQSKYEIGKITIRIVLVIAPFVICGVPFKLIDCGQVFDVVVVVSEVLVHVRLQLTEFGLVRQDGGIVL